MISLKEMDNQGFETEGRGNPDDQIHPSISADEDACLPKDETCPCVESQKDCSCSRMQPDAPRVELQTWVKPKGIMLVVVSVALIAWCTIYFTLSALQLL